MYNRENSVLVYRIQFTDLVAFIRTALNSTILVKSVNLISWTNLSGYWVGMISPAQKDRSTTALTLWYVLKCKVIQVRDLEECFVGVINCLWKRPSHASYHLTSVYIGNTQKWRTQTNPSVLYIVSFHKILLFKKGGSYVFNLDVGES